jgi:mannose-6-phosphate isomerase
MAAKNNLYPLKFTPILKSIIWGGNEIAKFKHLPAQDGVGESWEISDVSGDVSVVSNGALQGKSLQELIAEYGEQLLGKHVLERFGTTFPLLIKFIDAKQALSIQVHPDDELAKKRHDSFGKTEMWYVVKAAENAFLYSGFKEKIDANQYVKSLQDDTFTNYLQKHEVAAGDVFFLPAGRVHAIGAGCFIAEIQQTSNITYRIYDYNRKDAAGNPRELHTELAKDAIDYTVYSDYKLDYPKKDGVQELVECPYFTTNLIETKQDETITLSNTDTFVIVIALAGKFQLIDNQQNMIEIQQGESVLIPAANSSQISLIAQENSRLLETHI